MFVLSASLYNFNQGQKLSVWSEHLWLFILFTSLALPSGSLFDFPYRFALVALLYVLILISFIKNKNFLLFFSNNYMYFFLLIIFIYLNVGSLINPSNNLLQDLKLWLTLWSYLFFMSYFGFSRRIVLKTLTVLVYAILFFMLWKTFLFGLTFIHSESIISLIHYWFHITSIEPVLWELELGGLRINYINHDFASLFVFGALWFMRKQLITQKWLYVYLALLLLSVYIAYSRVLFLLVFLLIGYIAIGYLMAQHKKWFNGLLGIGLVVLSFLAFPYLQSTIEQRFLTSNDSDVIRNETIHQLLYATEQSPWIGYGLGASVSGFVRDDAEPISYEPQLLTLPLRFGWPLFLIVLSYLLYYVIKLASAPHSLQRFVALSVIIWLVLSLTNQYLFGSAATAMLVLMLLLAKVEVNNEKISR